MNHHNITSWNGLGFHALDKAMHCKSLLLTHKIDIFYIMELRISMSNLLNPFFMNYCSLFSQEDNYNKFNVFNPGRIQIKWEIHVIHDIIYTNLIRKIFIYAIYVVNSHFEIDKLCGSISNFASYANEPWIMLNEFNCYHFRMIKWVEYLLFLIRSKALMIVF